MDNEDKGTIDGFLGALSVLEVLIGLLNDMKSGMLDNLSFEDRIEYRKAIKEELGNYLSTPPNNPDDTIDN